MWWTFGSRMENRIYVENRNHKIEGLKFKAFSSDKGFFLTFFEWLPKAREMHRKESCKHVLGDRRVTFSCSTDFHENFFFSSRLSALTLFWGVVVATTLTYFRLLGITRLKQSLWPCFSSFSVMSESSCLSLKSHVYQVSLNHFEVIT